MCPQVRFSLARSKKDTMKEILLQGQSVTMEEELLLYQLMNLLEINGKVTITELIQEAIKYIDNLQQALR